MGKAAIRDKRAARAKKDPILDGLAVLDARNMLISNLLGMGWRLALMVLVPIFIGVQLDKKFDSSPSLTLSAFFLAIFGASLLIYKTFSQIQAEQILADAKKAKRKQKRSQHA